jgi:Holliday junction resolvase-like predicted endonuclease
MNKSKSFVFVEVKTRQTLATQLPIPTLPSFEPIAFI